MSDTLKLAVPGRPEYIQTVKLSVATAAGVNGFDFEKIEDMKLAVGEACKNVTCHAHDCWCKNYVLECLFEDDKVTIKIIDKKSEHSVSKDKRPCLDCPNEGDLGMKIVESLTDEVQVTKDGIGDRVFKMVICK